MRRTLLALALLAAAPARAQTPLAIAEGEQWFDFVFQGHKVGFMYALDEKTSVNERPAFHAKRWSVVLVRRQEQVVRIESTTDAWYELDGRPMRYEHVRLEGKDRRSSQGYRNGDEIVISHDVGGSQEERRFKLGPNVYLGVTLDPIFNSALRPDRKLAGQVLEEEEGQLRPFTMGVAGKEKTAQGEAFVVVGSVGNIEARQLVLPNGRAVKSEVPAIGAAFVATTREKAIAVDGEPIDIFSKALFSIPRPLPKGDSLDRVVVRLRWKSGRRPTHIQDAQQVGKPSGKDAVELTIRASAAPAKAAKLPITSAKQKVFLRPTPYEPLNDERLQAAAQRVLGGERDAWEAAKKINAFVHGHIKQKTLARAFGTAIEALESREGDCTEHSVLFSALAKIAGIPTKLNTGLVYVGGKDNVFGYHEWVEVWTGDRWVAMDPTFGQDLADPTHIKLAQGQSDPDGLRDAGVVAASMIGDLELEVLEYTDAEGRKLKP